MATRTALVQVQANTDCRDRRHCALRQCAGEGGPRVGPWMRGCGAQIDADGERAESREDVQCLAGCMEHRKIEVLEVRKGTEGTLDEVSWRLVKGYASERFHVDEEGEGFVEEGTRVIVVAVFDD